MVVLNKIYTKTAISSLNKSANGKLRLASFGLSKKVQSQSTSSVKDGSMFGDVANVVILDHRSKMRVAKNQAVSPSKPPGFIHGEI